MNDATGPSSQPAQVHSGTSGLLASLSNSITICLIKVPWWLAMLTLVFGGKVASYFGYATFFFVAGAIVSMFIVGFCSTWRGTIWLPQDIPAAILAVTSAQIIANADSSVSANALFVTIAALVAISTMVTGITFYCLGVFRLGNLVRYLPYPVIAGFLGGTGWLLLKAGTDVAMGEALQGIYWQSQGIAHGLPAILLAIAVYLAGSRVNHPLTLPALLLVATLCFHLVAFATGQSHAELSHSGWLFTALESGSADTRLTLADFGSIQWATIAGHSSSILVIAVGSVIAMLLNSTGFELQIDHELDVNNDLRATGLANILSAPLCGFPGYMSPAASYVNAKQGTQLPMSGLIAALMAGTIIWFALPLMNFIPLFVLGAAVAYIGVSFFVDWVVGSYKHVSRGEYCVVLLIVLAIAVFGLLPGVMAGLLMAIMLFLISFSRVDVVRRHLTGTHKQSRVTRSATERDYLEQSGQQIQIFELQGYIFFGTANRLLSQIRNLTYDIPAHFLILDFERVTGIDSTALSCFAKLHRDLAKKDVSLTFVNLSQHDQTVISQQFTEQLNESVRIFASLDQALQWSEEQQLRTKPEDPSTRQASLLSYLTEVLPDADNFDRMLALLDRQVMHQGEYLMRQNTDGADLYFFEQGSVTVQLKTDDGSVLRLETLQQGVAGELAFYLRKKRTASVVCDNRVITYRLTRERLQELEMHHPTEANTLHRLIVNLLALRVTHLLGVVKTLRV